MSEVTIFLPSARAGGVERAMIDLANGLAKRGLRVELLLAKAEGPFLEKISPRVPVHDLHARRVRFAIPRLARRLRRNPPRWLIAAMNHIGVAALLARGLAHAPTRVVVSVHNMPTYTLLRSPKLIDWLLYRLAAHLFAFADVLTTISSTVADDMAEVFRLPRSEIAVISNPLDLEEIERQSKQPLDHPWFKQERPPVLLNVGRLTAQKDHATLLRAFGLVQKERPARLLILGEGEARPALENMVQRLSLADSVSMPGFSDNPYTYMRRSRLYVSSSAWEGQPVVLLEALACGMPVVSTDCPGGLSEILRGGEFGWLVPVGDEQRLASAILEALDTSPEPEIQRARARDFRLEAVVQRWIELLDLSV